MIGAALGLASNAISGIIGLAQMNKANKQIQTAKNAQTAAMNEFKGINVVNPFANTQLNTMAFDRSLAATNQALAQGTEAAKGAGAEGVIGSTGAIYATVEDANRRAAEDLANRQDEAKRIENEAQLGINKDKGLREEAVAGMKLGQAMEGQQTAEANKQAGFEGLTKGITGAMSGAAGLIGLYGKNKAGISSDTFKNTKKIVTPNYNGSVSGDYGTPVDMTGITSIFD